MPAILNRDNYFSGARALYWYCSDWHSGQWSDLYRIMCALKYRPSPTEKSPTPEDEDPTDHEFYKALEQGEIDPQNLLESINLILDTDP